MKNIYWRQVIISVLPRLGTTLLGFLLARLLIIELGAENYGDWAAITNIFVASSFLTFGVASSFVNYVLIYKDASPKKLAVLFTNSIAIIAISGTTLIAIAIVVLSLDLSSARYAQYIPICIAVLIVSMIHCLVSSAYQGLTRIQANEYAAFTIYGLLYVGVIISGASTAANVLLIYFLATLAAVTIFGTPIFRAYFVTSTRAIKPSQLKKLLSPAKWFFFSQIFAFILYGSDRILTLALIGSASVTDYDLVMKLLSPLLLVSSLVLAPSWSYFSQGSKREILKFFIGFEVVFAVSLLVGFMSIQFFPAIVSVLFRHELQEHRFIGLILIAIAIQIHTQPYCYYLNAKGKVKAQAILNGIAAAMNVALSILLAKDFGLSGVVMATILSTIPFLVYSTRSVIKDLRAEPA